MNPWGASRSNERGMSTKHNYYLPLVMGLVARPVSVVGVPSTAPRHHNGIRRIGGPEPAPRPIVPPASRRHALAAPEPQPVGHVCFGNPHSLFAARLREDDDIGQGSTVAEPSTKEGAA